MRGHTLTIIIGLILTVSLNAITLKNGHNWGGDFAQYIINAKNLLNHQPINDGVMLENSLSYPPGLALLLSPLFYFFGLNFKLLKSFNIICWLIILITLWRIFKPRLSPINTILLISVFALSSFFFLFKQNILADIPFFCTSLLAVNAYLSKRPLSFTLYLMLSLLLRSAGLIFFSVSIIFYLCHRQWRMSFYLSLALIGTLTFISIINPSPSTGFLNTFWYQPITQLGQALYNSPLVWQSLVWFFIHGITPLTIPIYTIACTIITICSPLIYLGLIVYFIKLLRQHTLNLLPFFALGYIGMLFYWTSFNDSPDNFTRYIFPLTPLLGYILSRSYFIQRPRITALILSTLLIINIGNVYLLRHYNDDELITLNSNSTLLEWMRHNIQPNEHYMMIEPRPAALMTNRVGTSTAWLAFNPPSTWPTLWRRMHITYIILHRFSDKKIIETLKSFKQVNTCWDNDTYQIFKINARN